VLNSTHWVATLRKGQALAKLFAQKMELALSSQAVEIEDC
jgi:hypothetical protein